MNNYSIWLIIINIICIANGLNNITVSSNVSQSYDPEQLLSQILSYQNITSRQSGYGLVTFDDQSNAISNDIREQGTYGYIRFGDQNQPPNYDQNLGPNYDQNLGPNYDQNLGPNYEQNQRPNYDQNLGPNYDQNLGTNYDQNLGPPNYEQHLGPNNDQQNPISNQETQPIKKKRRRRRKPKFQHPGQGQYGLQDPALVNPNQFDPQYRPHRRRRPSSLAEDALISVTRALGSIAQYDDFQCVPRLLCEVAGGKGPNSGGGQNSILPSFISLQPLITLLAAYNGISSSPLFVFGRAVFLGLTSKGNTGSCNYAYPLCPTDPDKLVDYLNNHNGGFFRFFNGAPQPFPPGIPNQQNLQQFYSHLSNIQQPGNPIAPNNQNYGLLPNPYETNQNYGLYIPGLNIQEQNYGLINNQGVNQLNYGGQYPYYGNNKYGYLAKQSNEIQNDIDSNRIEKRIQNKPGIVYVESKFEGETDSKWTFPESQSIKSDTYTRGQREIKSLKFPEEKPTKYISYDESIRKGKAIFFPGSQSNRQYVDYYNYPPLTQLPQNLDANKLKYDDDGYYIDNDNDNDEGVEVIYVLRGNGDPNNPEVVKLKPGQKI